MCKMCKNVKTDDFRPKKTKPQNESQYVFWGKTKFRVALGAKPIKAKL